ncbi:MAG: hypothetical protein BV457_08065 [Thermoplasmata archaeon M9B1D]|nr:MAG: hypothetical protein BV457_08065 [Thermoplasmata archaeon M9B1D]
MTKVDLDIQSFKVLASETRLDILKSLDGKKMSLNDICRATNLHKMTLHEHLIKLPGKVKVYFILKILILCCYLVPHYLSFFWDLFP